MQHNPCPSCGVVGAVETTKIKHRDNGKIYHQFWCGRCDASPQGYAESEQQAAADWNALWEQIGFDPWVVKPIEEDQDATRE